MGYHCRPKDQGGLGIENLEVKNRCLLSKWLWNLSFETDAMWAQILRSKYLQTKSLSQVTVRPTDSPFWKGLMKVKQSLFNRTKVVIGNGVSTRFWEDTWSERHPWPFNIRLYIVLFNDVRCSLLRCFNPSPLIFSSDGR